MARSTKKQAEAKSPDKEAEDLELEAAPDAKDALPSETSPADLAEVAETPETKAEITGGEQEAGPIARRGGFVPVVLGGVVAAAVGFGTSQYLVNDGWPFSRGPSKVDLLETWIEQQSTTIEALDVRISELTAIVQTPKVDPRIGEMAKAQGSLQTTMNGLSRRIDGLDRGLKELANRPIPDIGATQQAVASYEKELSGMRDMFQSELERIEAAQIVAMQVEQSSALQASNALERAALAKLDVAIESGAPLGPVLDRVRDAGIVVPDVLLQYSDNGVPTMARLLAEFPADARLALDASLTASVAAGETGKITAFLRRQIGTRSLSAQDGDDADAILSRAEAALKKGDLTGAIGEIETLESAAKDAMADWTQVANSRQNVTDAARALSETTSK